MTENEAKTKWCPFAHSRGVDVLSGQNIRSFGVLKSDDEEGINLLCIASECMAWRATDNEIKENPSSPVEHGRARSAADYGPAGYCGLAGK
jgi:hypothetical protein